MGGVKFKFWFILLVPFFVIMQSLPVGAVASQETFWSWTDAEPEIVYSKLIDDINHDNCPTISRTIKISGEIGEYDACVYEGEVASFAVYWSSGSRFAVKLPNDNKMYKFHSECGMYNPCIYLPNTDTLVMKRSVGNGGIGLLLIYKNFTKRLIPIQNGLIREYNFDDSEPDYTSHFPDGDYWLINGFNASDNGKWLAVEILNRGFALINIDTLQTKQIDNQYFGYWVGMNPTPELALSNDGHHLAVTGINSGFRIVDIDNTCGAEMSYHNVPKTPISNPCKESPVNINLAIDWFRTGYKPRFSSDGGEIVFYAESNLFEKREIALRTSQYQTRYLQYLALGDSFTSGEGELDDKYYLPRTNDKFERCHLSSRSYPFLISSMYNFNPNLSKSVACSGATAGDINGNKNTYQGQGDRLGVGNDKMGLDSSEMLLATNQAEQDFIPGRIKQIRFVEKYKPELITIGIGGNDAGLMDKLATCASPGTCKWASDDVKRAQTAIEISNLFDKLVKTYQDIHSKSTNSKIYVIGYPKIINPEGKCGITINAIFTDEEKQFINESVSYLNQIIYSATRRAGVGYIDVEDSFKNQALCGDIKPLAMNSIEFGDDSKQAWVVGIGNETFHPNHIGHKLIANTLKTKINTKYCQNSEKICPDETIKIPSPLAYWAIDDSRSYTKQQKANFLTESGGQNKLIAKLEPYSLEPNSEVKIEIQSEPTPLGVFKADEFGGIDIELQLPDNLDYGYHTVYLDSKSYSGEEIEFYQTIKHVAVQLDGEVDEEVVMVSAFSDSNQPPVQSVSYENKTWATDKNVDSLKPAVLGDKVINPSSEVLPVNKNNTALIVVLVFTVILIPTLYYLSRRIFKIRS